MARHRRHTELSQDGVRSAMPRRLPRQLKSSPGYAALNKKHRKDKSDIAQRWFC